MLKLKDIGIERLNELQKIVIPKVAEGRDILITAPTGSGKTECAVIPILKMMLRMNCKGISFLYITPLRALNRDLIWRLKIFAENLGFSIAVRHGDTSNSERRIQSLKPPQILPQFSTILPSLQKHYLKMRESFHPDIL